MLEQRLTRSLRLFVGCCGLVALLMNTLQAETATAAIPGHPSLAGKLLVAMPHLSGSWFSESVVLLLTHRPSGASGVVLNRPTDSSLHGLLPGLEGSRFAERPLFTGGPLVRDERLLMLLRGRRQPGSYAVVPNVFFVHDAVRFMSGFDLSKPPKDMAVFLGYAGWGPFQLDREVLRGDWLVLPARASLIFDYSSQQLWPYLIRFGHAQMASLTPLN